MKKQANWFKIIFSDEKMFNFDGPDGLIHIDVILERKKTYFVLTNLGNASKKVKFYFLYTVTL